MKIPPLKEMEPLPPVPELPTCSHIDASADVADEICELSSDSDVDDEDVLPEGVSLASAEAGSFLDIDLPKVCCNKLFNTIVFVSFWLNQYNVNNLLGTSYLFEQISKYVKHKLLY